jgi:hypothetical protein
VRTVRTAVSVVLAVAAFLALFLLWQRYVAG